MKPLYLTMDTLPDVVGLSKSTIESEIRASRFPKPRQLSGRRTGWLVREIEDWAEARPVSDLPPPPNTSGGGKKRQATGGIQQAIQCVQTAE
jgi:prophage regulatory protein